MKVKSNSKKFKKMNNAMVNDEVLNEKLENVKNESESNSKNAENTEIKEIISDENLDKVKDENSEIDEVVKNEEDKKDEKEELLKKIDELNDKYLRLYSEYDNYRKRTLKERIELIKNAGEDIIKLILPVLDDFERAKSNMNQSTDLQAIKEGVELIYNKLKNILIQQGIEEMKTIGEMFNPELHEALTHVPAESEEQKGKIIDETQKGYILNGKIIRFPKVVVAN